MVDAKMTESVSLHLAPGDPTKQPFLLPPSINKRQITSISRPCSPRFPVSANIHWPLRSTSFLSLLPYVIIVAPIYQHSPVDKFPHASWSPR